MSKAYCQDCGQALPMSMKYCPKCGSSNINSNQPHTIPTNKPYLTGTNIKSNFQNSGSSYQSYYVNNKATNSHNPLINTITETMASIVSFVSIVIFILVPIGALTIYPAYNENVTNNCSALETHVVSIISRQNKSLQNDIALNIFGGRLLTEISNGSMASAYIKELYPEIPPSIACTWEYWRVLLDDNHAQQLLSKLK